MEIIPAKLTKALALVATIVIIMNGQARTSNLRMSGEREDDLESCHLRELELCSMGFMSIFQNPNGLPAKEAEFKRQCEFFNESIRCIDKYAHNCLLERQSALADLFLQAPASLVNDFCRDDSEIRKNYTKHIECLREIQHKHQKECVSDLQTGFEGIHKLNASVRLTTACCTCIQLTLFSKLLPASHSNMNRFKDCIFGPINYECGLEASETIERLIMSISGTWFTLPCRAYDPSQPECQRLLPAPGTKPHTGRNTSALSRVVSSFAATRDQML